MNAFTPRLAIVSALVFVAALAMNASSRRLSAAPDVAAPQAMAECRNEPCRAVARGFVAFIDRNFQSFGSNGRSCADCHMVTDDFQLSPASVEARFKWLQFLRRFNPRADDPLFRAIDADDFRTNGENASDFSNLRQNGLVRVSIPLPPNVKLIDPATNAPSSEIVADVWRAVPTIKNVALTGADGLNAWPRGPNNTGGYQLDARAATLEEQALGAFRAHAEVGDPIPQKLLDDLASFQRAVFNNDRVADLADAIQGGVTPLPDPDPVLNELEGQGKTVFQRACTQCHGGPSLSSAQAPVPRYQEILTQCPRPVDIQTPPRFVFAACPPQLARNVRTYEFTLANGSKLRRSSSDPGRALLTGFVGGPAPQDDWQKFDVPGLRGIRQTAPYFHNNSAATLEQVVDHYIEFFKRVQANMTSSIPPPVLTTDGVNIDRPPAPAERAALLAYLRKL